MKSSSQTLNVSRYFSFQKSDRPLRFLDVASSEDGWIENSSATFDQQFAAEEIWIRLPLENRSRENLWYITLDNTRLDFVDFWLVTSGDLQSYSTGDARVLSGQEPAAYPVFRFELLPEHQGTIYIRIKSNSHISFTLQMHGAQAFGSMRNKEILVQWVLAFILFVYIVYQYFVNFQNEKRLFLFFLSMVLGGSLYAFVLMGDGNLVLWPAYPWLKNRALYISSLFAGIFGLFFLRDYLALKDSAPRFHRFLYYYAIVLLLVLIFCLSDVENRSKSFITGFAFLGVSVFLVAGFVLNLKLRRYWVVSLLFSLTMAQGVVVPYILMLLGILPYNSFFVYGTLIIFPLDLIMIPIGIVQRYNALKQERDLLSAEAKVSLDKEYFSLVEKIIPSSDQRALRVRNLNVEQIREMLFRFIEKEEIHLVESVRLSDVAKGLSIRPDQLSALLNLELGVSFSTLLNEYRIREAQRLIVSSPGKNLLEIAMDCGFGSRASFNRVFKQAIGVSPMEYRRQKNKLAAKPQLEVESG